MTHQLPARYETISVLGAGGGGTVWAVRDKLTGETLALKALAKDAPHSQVSALVREAVTLSGLEGLGVPRVLRFGRLRGTGQPYMVRDLVPGNSLQDLLDQKSASSTDCLTAVIQAADQLTGLHRFGLLHGDVKPANIIVPKHGTATLVDLGLSAPWREDGTRPVGWTPHFAAPELLDGNPFTVRAEIYALGVTLNDVLNAFETQLTPELLGKLTEIKQHAMNDIPGQRYPSADELASAIRHAMGLPARDQARTTQMAWPLVGLEMSALGLLDEINAMTQGQVMAVVGAPESGKSTLLRRVAWTIGVDGRDVAWVQQEATLPWTERIELELGECSNRSKAIVLVDDAHQLPSAAQQLLERAREQGARLVMVVEDPSQVTVGPIARTFEVPRLSDQEEVTLLRRVIPSLPNSLIPDVQKRAQGRPGKLRRLAKRLQGEAIVSKDDLEQVLGTHVTSLVDPNAPATIEQVEHLLDQGKVEQAAGRLKAVAKTRSVRLDLCRARLAVVKGRAGEALEQLNGLAKRMSREPNAEVRQMWRLQKAKTLLRLGEYGQAVREAGQVVEHAAGGKSPVVAEALACAGLAESFQGHHDQATDLLGKAKENVEGLLDKRVEAIVLGSLALALQRADKLREARQAYERTVEAAEQAGDAGAVATTQLNLGVLANIQGDLAEAGRRLEAAIDMGQRSGRVSTTRQALLNLVNLDIYLGRFARARSGLATLLERQEQMSAVQRAQLRGLEAELSARTGELDKAAKLYQACGDSYEQLHRQVDAAEAWLEGVVLESKSPQASWDKLSATIEKARTALADGTAHLALLGLAQGVVALANHDADKAKEHIEKALEYARGAGQKEWIWRSLEARANMYRLQGQHIASRRDLEEALSILEDIASKLPRDLREVFWDDPRRHAIRMAQQDTALSPNTLQIGTTKLTLTQPGPNAVTGNAPSSTLMPVSVENRLKHLLEINRELAREHDLEKVLERVTDHAIALVHAERGFVILKNEDKLSVHTSRNPRGNTSHQLFSRNIAEQVIATAEPIVTLSALNDERMAGYLSVHQLEVQSVACVPIRAPDNRTAGALYVETRQRPGNLFYAELSSLTAFADQAAVAIENARLISENQRRAEQLEKTNQELEAARKRLKEMLGHRTAQLASTRRDLHATRAVLRGHFGYQGLVGNSQPMRRIYALIERVKDMDVPVLISGESGTGKEIVARAIHKGGPRGRKPFTGINCGAIPEHLLESELFGHVRGAFTGANRDRAGLFREASESTLLLDEIGEMPYKMQASLLRVLQEHVVRPVGGERDIPVSARVIAATNRNLQQMVSSGTFREDLYYRLHVVDIHLPPLRERADDIPMLVDHFLNIFAKRYGRTKKSVSREALRALATLPWPGNVRQLENVLLNAWVMSERDELSVDDFDVLQDIPIPKRTSSRPAAPSSEPSEPTETSILSSREHAEKEQILAALHANNWNRVKAAEQLGMARRTFYRRLKKYGIQ